MEYVEWQSFFAEVEIQQQGVWLELITLKMYCQEPLKEIVLKQEKQEEMINFFSNWNGGIGENINKGFNLCLNMLLKCLFLTFIIWIKM